MSHVHRLSLPTNSTNVRFMFETLLQRAGLRASAALAPALAGAWAERLFLTPPRLVPPNGGLFELSDARAGFVAHGARRLATWTWGPERAPAALLVHGWGGAGTQMRHFAHPLRSLGYRVITFDQPAHGASDGHLTGLPDLARAIRSVAHTAGDVRVAVAHSLGAAATALALAGGLKLETAVLISPPADLVAHSKRFARWYRIPESVRRAMQAAIEERFGVAWSELELGRLGPRLAARALVIHDCADRMVPVHQGLKFAQAWPDARWLPTTGLGHLRILSAPEVIRAALDFVSGHSQVASLALPALPQPAPLV